MFLSALVVNNLSTTWTQYKQYLKPEVLGAIGWCADSLPAEEDAIDPEALARFEDEVEEFGTRIASGDLPDYVKSFMLEQVRIIQQAIREYPISGAKAFKHGYVESFFNFSENQEVVFEYEESEEIQELGGFWRKLQIYAQKAGPWIAIGQAAIKVWEITGGGG